MLLCEGCCDGEEDGDVGVGGVFENGREVGEVGDSRIFVEKEIEVAMGVDEGWIGWRGWKGCVRVHGGLIVGFG